MSFSAKLDHCVIHVSNWERSNEFYQKVLGAELIDDGGRVAYRFGDTPWRAWRGMMQMLRA